jgi:hypothetical protein
MNRVKARQSWCGQLLWAAAGLLLVLASGCSAARGMPEVRNYPASGHLSVDAGPFQQAGCPLDDSGRNLCPPDSPLGQLDCDYIATPGSYLGGLDPAYPLNLCWRLGRGGQTLPREQYLYREGCLLPQYARYVIVQDGQYRLLESQADFQQTFAPITSQDEALSYALAVTGLSAYYALEASPGFRYFVDRLEDSHVVETPQGYLVYLYHYQFCGCGPHTTSYVEVLIKPDGSLQETGRTPVFEDPEQDGLCID